MLSFIECIIDSTTDLKSDYFYYSRFEQIQSFYTYGGCYEFVKIVKHFLPNIKIFVNKGRKIEHCIFSYNDILYDANGEIKNIEDYRIATKEDIEYMERNFGKDEVRYINGIPFVEAMIEILNSCNLESTIDRIKNEKENGTSIHH